MSKRKNEVEKEVKTKKKVKQSMLFRKVSTLTVQLKKNNLLKLNVNIGYNAQKHVSFDQFDALFQSMKKSCQTCLLHFEKYEIGTDFIFDDNIVVSYTMKGTVPETYKQIVHSETKFQNRDNGCLFFTVIEHQNLTDFDSNIHSPSQVLLYEKWVFLYKSKCKYEFFKLVTGTSKQNACSQIPTYHINMTLEKGSTNTKNYTQSLITRAFEIFGYDYDCYLKLF